MSYPNQENIDRWLFDWTEGNLSPAQEIMLEEFLLKHPEHEVDADLWRQATLTFPDFAEEVEINLPEEKSKKRRVLLWMLPLLILPLWLITPFFRPNATSKTVSAKSNITPTRFTKNTGNYTPSRKNLFRNLSLTNAYPNYTHTKPMNFQPVSNPLRKISLGFNNSSEVVALTMGKNECIEASIQSQFDLPTQNLKMEKITLCEENTTQELQSALGNEEITSITAPAAEDITTEKSKSHLHLPSLKLTKSTMVGKYLLKDVVASSQKDRIYLVPEKTHLDLNMGMAGDMSQSRFQSSSMVRWFNQSNNQKLSQQLSFDTYLRNLKSGLAVTANYSHFGMGAIQDWNLNVIYSPKVALGQYITLSPSIGYQFGRKSMNINKINNHQYFAYNTNQIQQFNFDLSLPVGQKLFYRDLSAGMLVNAGPIYLGAQVSNVLRHQDNIYTNNYDTVNRANRTYVFLAGTDFKAKKGLIVFSPTVFHERNESYANTQYSATLQLNRFVLGGNYGSNKNISCMVGFTSERFALLMQSTKMRNTFTQTNRYIHQLTLRINSNISRKTRRYLYL